jgi:hypothetical protein
MRGMRLLLLALSAIPLAACGVASISPIVDWSDREFDPALVGDWHNTEDKDIALITGDADSDYRITYIDEDGDTARFVARLGRLGAHRVLDIEPDADAIGDHSLYFESLILLLHSFVIIDDVSPTELRFRRVHPDSLSATLDRDPDVVAHRPGRGEEGPVITARTPEVRSFFTAFISQPGVLSDSVRFRRR